MARKHLDGAMTWSLCWSAAAGRDFLAHPLLATRIRDRLMGAHRQPGRALLYFVLMPSEIHAVSRIDDGVAIGGVARSFSHVLSRWVREAQAVRGAVFTGPCRAVPVASMEALSQEIRMLAWRPVKRELCMTPTHYPLGTLRIALGLKPGDGFDARPLWLHFGETLPQARSAIRDCIRLRPSDEEWRFWELIRGLELTSERVGIGPSKMMSKAVDAAAATLIAAGGSYGIDGALRLIELWVRAKINLSSGLDLHAGSGALVVRGRALVACLAVTHGLCSAALVARYFERAKATLSEQMAACRERPADRLILSTPLRRILEEAAALQAATVMRDSGRTEK